MQIESGKLYENKCLLYLYPCLRLYGKEFIEKFKGIIKLGVGFKDYNFENKFNSLYILLDTKPPSKNSIEIVKYTQKLLHFLDFIRTKDYYVSDYLYEGINERYSKHMVVIKLPKQLSNNNILLEFKQGNYSKMYSEDEINKIFYLPSDNKRLNVLLKKPSYVQTFVDIVNTDYDTDATVEDFKDAELDYPPFIWEETFNYKIT